MKWLTYLTGTPTDQRADTRFVAREPLPPGPMPPRPVVEQDVENQDVAPAVSARNATSRAEQPSCTLISQDTAVIDLVAGIALSAAVRVNHYASVLQYQERGQQPAPAGPVLWGADQLPELDAAGIPCDVLIGQGADSEELWLVAGTRPQVRVAVLPHAAAWLGEYLGQWALRSGHGHTIMFSALAGGIGTSTLACLLAHAGTLSGLQSLVVDLDPFSRSLWPALSWQPNAGIGWEHLQGSGGTLAAHQFADMLARVHDTGVLTWQQEPAGFPIDEALMVRVLAAARQAFDLVILDAGRHRHPLGTVLEHFVDRQVITCQGGQVPRLDELPQDVISCAAATASDQQPVPSARLLGHFPPSARIAGGAQRAELLQVLRSRRLRQRLADYDLLPRTGTARS